MEYHSGGSLPLLGRPRYCPGAGANGGYLCETGHCCGETGCCTYYYELWWFWLLWTVLILFSCCCAYRHRRAKLRVQQQQRQREISLLAYHGASSYPSSMLDLSFLASLKLPSYEEVAAQPSTPPPPYSSVFTAPRYPQPPRAADPHLLTQHDPLLHRPLSDGPSSLSSDNSSSCSCDSCCPSSPCSSSLSAPVTYETDTSHASTPSEAAPLALDVTMETIAAAATCLEADRSRFASADVSATATPPRPIVSVAPVAAATPPPPACKEALTPDGGASAPGTPLHLAPCSEEPAQGLSTPSPPPSARSSPTGGQTPRTLALTRTFAPPLSAGPSGVPAPRLPAQSPGSGPTDGPRGGLPQSSDPLASSPDARPPLGLLPDVAPVVVVPAEADCEAAPSDQAPPGGPSPPATPSSASPQPPNPATASASPAVASPASPSVPAITVHPAQSPLAPALPSGPAPALSTPPLLLDPLAALSQPDRGASSPAPASSLSPSPRATQSPPKQTLFSPCVDVFEAEPSAWETGQDRPGQDDDEDMEADESQYRHRRLTGDSGIEVCRCRIEDEDEDEDEEEGEEEGEEEEEEEEEDREKKGGADTHLHDSVDCPARGQISTGEGLTLCGSAPSAPPACEDSGKVVIAMETV